MRHAFPKGRVAGIVLIGVHGRVVADEVGISHDHVRRHGHGRTDTGIADGDIVEIVLHNHLFLTSYLEKGNNEPWHATLICEDNRHHFNFRSAKSSL